MGLGPRPAARRNDPCPCGSGRKYKVCHLGHETHSLDDRAGWLYEKAQRFLRNRYPDLVEDLAGEIVDEFDQPELYAALTDGPFLGDIALHEDDVFAEFLAARDALLAGRTLVLMDADVLYDARLMQRLLGSTHPNVVLLDRDIEPGDEPVKLCIQDGVIVDFHKRPQAAHQWHGESVGFFRLSATAAAELAHRADTYVQGGRRHMEYEEPLRDMIQANPSLFGFEDVTGLPWTEIDFPEDVAKAHGLLPSLVA